MGRDALMRALGLKDAKHFRRHYLLPAMSAGLVEMTQPDHPRSPTQQYRRTTAGQWQVDEGGEKSSDYAAMLSHTHSEHQPSIRGSQGAIEFRVIQLKK